MSKCPECQEKLASLKKECDQHKEERFKLESLLKELKGLLESNQKIPVKYVRMGGILNAVYGTSSIGVFDRMYERLRLYKNLEEEVKKLGLSEKGVSSILDKLGRLHEIRT
jgi:hypothetical protein